MPIMLVPMLIELTRLALGLAIAYFHRPIADFILAQERALVIMFRQRGLPLPATPTTETTRTIYFIIGISLAMLEIGRIWVILHPNGALPGLFVR
jgi:hypothetical protein